MDKYQECYLYIEREPDIRLCKTCGWREVCKDRGDEDEQGC